MLQKLLDNDLARDELEHSKNALGCIIDSGISMRAVAKTNEFRVRSSIGCSEYLGARLDTLCLSEITHLINTLCMAF
jgi:hypothetical protein